MNYRYKVKRGEVVKVLNACIKSMRKIQVELEPSAIDWCVIGEAEDDARKLVRKLRDKRPRGHGIRGWDTMAG